MVIWFIGASGLIKSGLRLADRLNKKAAIHLAEVQELLDRESKALAESKHALKCIKMLEKISIETKLRNNLDKYASFPECSMRCDIIASLGASECEAVCPWKFNEDGSTRTVNEIIHHLVEAENK